MSFIKYLRETEEAEVEQEMDEKKAKIIALFTTGEPVTDETIGSLADELEMDAEEIKAEVYTILSDLLMAQAEEVGAEMEDEEPVEEMKDELAAGDDAVELEDEI